MSVDPKIADMNGILLIKGWFENVDLINGLKVCFGKWSNIDPLHVSEYDAFFFVCRLYENYCKNQLNIHKFSCEALKMSNGVLGVKELINTVCHQIRFSDPIHLKIELFMPEKEQCFFPIDEETRYRFNLAFPPELNPDDVVYSQFRSQTNLNEYNCVRAVHTPTGLFVDVGPSHSYNKNMKEATEKLKRLVIEKRYNGDIK